MMVSSFNFRSCFSLWTNSTLPSLSFAHIRSELFIELCLSAGSAISTICAVAKGQAIGTNAERDDSNENQQQRDKAKKKYKELDVIEVMHSKLKLEDGLALVGSETKRKLRSEALLEDRFWRQVL